MSIHAVTQCVCDPMLCVRVCIHVCACACACACACVPCANSALLRHEVAYVLGQMQSPAALNALEISLKRTAPLSPHTPKAVT